MSSSADARPPASHFGAIAGSYDRLRPVDEKWWQLFDLLVAAGDLAGRRTLDVGCGTGTLAVALAERGGKVWGVDSSPEMLAEAQAKETRARFKEGAGEWLCGSRCTTSTVRVRLQRRRACSCRAGGS
jgi:ubiquinone/menaquinone biosynthesis C-methylase UbiE